MKKILILFMITTIMIVGCGKQKSTEVVKENNKEETVEKTTDTLEINKTEMICTIKDVNHQSGILLLEDITDRKYEITIENEEYNVGDRLRITYDGQLTRSIPAQIVHVYNVEKIEEK